jgi:hypothetical protein
MPPIACLVGEAVRVFNKPGEPGKLEIIPYKTSRGRPGFAGKDGQRSFETYCIDLSIH